MWFKSCAVSRGEVWCGRRVVRAGAQPEASTLGSRCPEINASIIARAVTPCSSESTAEMFVDAGGVVGAAAVADGDLAALEVADELGPFGVRRGPVFLGGAQRAAAGDEGAVAVDRFLG